MNFNQQTGQLEGTVEIPEKGLADSIMHKIVWGTCPDCKGEGVVEQGRNDDITKVKCHCHEEEDTDDDSDINNNN